jgi:hypothetical protein
VIIIADGHELPIGAGHRREQTYGTPQGVVCKTTVWMRRRNESFSSPRAARHAICGQFGAGPRLGPAAGRSQPARRAAVDHQRTTL